MSSEEGYAQKYCTWNGRNTEEKNKYYTWGLRDIEEGINNTTYLDNSSTSSEEGISI